MSISHRCQRICVLWLFLPLFIVEILLHHWQPKWVCHSFLEPSATVRHGQKSNEMILRSCEVKNVRFLLSISAVGSDDNGHERIVVSRPGNNIDAVGSVEKAVKEKRVKAASGLDIPYNSAINALRIYHEIHGNLLIPRRYLVPSAEIGEKRVMFPTEWHGIDLSCVYNMKWWQKHVKQRPERVAELHKLGFVWGRLQPEWNIILDALISYYNLYGDVSIAQNFVIPSANASWPMASWGMPLGKIVNRIRARHDFFRGNEAADRRRQLDGLGFVWDRQEQQFQIFYNALRYYAFKHEMGPYSTTERIKPLRVPSSYTIPYNDDSWPQEMWNYSLGAKCTAVRQQGIYVKNRMSRQKLLEELGFRRSGNSMFGWLSVVHAAAIYSRLNNRILDVPIDFYVPSPPLDSQMSSDDWPWPSYLWGLPLGLRLKDIRVKGAYLTGKDRNARIQQLDALGFNWKPKRGRPKKTKNIDSYIP